MQLLAGVQQRKAGLADEVGLGHTHPSSSSHHWALSGQRDQVAVWRLEHRDPVKAPPPPSEGASPFEVLIGQRIGSASDNEHRRAGRLTP